MELIGTDTIDVKREMISKVEKNEIIKVATLMFGISSAVLGYNVFLLSRRNRFSKNISLNNNYFLNYQDYEENEAPEYLNDGSSDEGQVEGEIIQELPPSEQNAMFIIGQVEDMYIIGVPMLSFHSFSWFSRHI